MNFDRVQPRYGTGDKGILKGGFVDVRVVVGTLEETQKISPLRGRFNDTVYADKLSGQIGKEWFIF